MHNYILPHLTNQPHKPYVVPSPLCTTDVERHVIAFLEVLECSGDGHCSQGEKDVKVVHFRVNVLPELEVIYKNHVKHEILENVRGERMQGARVLKIIQSLKELLNPSCAKDFVVHFNCIEVPSQSKLLMDVVQAVIFECILEICGSLTDQFF